MKLIGFLFRKRFWIWSLSLVALLFLLVWTATSSFFITGFVVPRIRGERWRISLERCFVSREGTGLENFSIHLLNKSGGTNVSFFIPRGYAGYTMGALLEEVPRLELLEAVNAKIVIYTPEDGGEILTPKKRGSLGDLDLKEEINALDFPLAVDYLAIRGATLTRSRGEERWRIRGAGEISNLGPHRDCDVSLHGDLSCKEKEVVVERLPLSLKARLGFARSLLPISVSGSLAGTNFLGRVGNVSLADWSISGSVKGDSENGGRRVVVKEAGLKLLNGSEEVCSLNSKSSLDFDSGDASLDFFWNLMPCPVWNSLVIFETPLILNSMESQMQGRLDWRNGDKNLSLACRGFYRGLKYGQESSLPELSGDLACTGSFAAVKRSLSLEALSLTAKRPDGRNMGALRLKRPLLVERGSEGMPIFHSAACAFFLEDAELMWLKPFMEKEMASILGGTVSLKGDASYDPLLDTSFGSLKCTLDKGAFDQGKNSYRDLNGEMALEMSLCGGTNITLNLRSMSASIGQQPMASLSLMGGGDLAGRRLDLAWNVNQVSSLVWSPQEKPQEIWKFSSSGNLKMNGDSLILPPCYAKVSRGFGKPQGLSMEGSFFLKPELGPQKLKIQGGDFDLDALLGEEGEEAAAGGGQGGEESQGASSSDDYIAPMPLGDWHGSFEADFNSLRYETWVFSPCKFGGTLSNSYLSILTKDAGVCGGGASLQLDFDFKGENIPYTLDGAGTNISLSAAMECVIAGSGGQFGGTGEVDYRSQSTVGGSISNYTAQIDAFIHNGAFHHMPALEKLASTLHYSELSDFNFDDYRFHCSVTNRVFTMDKSEAKSKTFGLKWGGTIDFDSNIDISLNLTLSARAMGQIIGAVSPGTFFEDAMDKSYSLPPIIVTGTLEQPRVVGTENVLRSILETFGSNVELILDILPTQMVKEKLKEGVEKIEGLFNQDSNSDAARQTDKIIEKGRAKLRKILGN